MRVIQTDCAVSLPFQHPPPNPLPPNKPYQAIWDTGATGSVISPKVVQALNLQPITMQYVQDANSKRLVNVYLIALYLPNNIIFGSIKVTEANLGSGGPDVLIGMDVIAHGDFALTCKGGKTKFSFQFPSGSDIDFAKQATPPKKKKRPQQKKKKVRKPKPKKTHRKK